jgi:hypothetical protein
MPSKSAKQARLMRAVAHNPKFAKKVGIPQKVGRDYASADKAAGKYAKGGKVLKSIKELMDPVGGKGAVPLNQEVDYFGFKKEMTPSKFLGTAKHIATPRKSSLDAIRKHIDEGGKIGNPFLKVDWQPDTKTWKTVGHDGRHRSMVLKEKGLDQPMDVHVFPLGLRARDLTPEMKEAPITPEYAKGGKVKGTLDAIRNIGMKIRYKDGEFRINHPHGDEDTAVYTDDAEDAINTAHAMLRDWRDTGRKAERAVPGLSPLSPPTYNTGRTTPIVINTDQDRLGKIKTFLDDYKAATAENFINPIERMMPDYSAAVELQPFDGKIHINSIRSVKPGERTGAGSKALQQIIELANKHNVELDLFPKPYGSKALDEQQLREWYARKGFVPDDDSMLYTPPVKKAKGGKVKKLSDWIADDFGRDDVLPFYHGMHGENTKKYIKSLGGWDPLLNPEEFQLLDKWSMGDWAGSKAGPLMDDLVRRHGVPLSSIANDYQPIMRAINLDKPRASVKVPNVGAYSSMGADFTTLHPQSTTIDKNVVDAFADAGAWEESIPLKMQIHPKSDIPILPIPGSGQSELLLPRGTGLRVVDKYTDDEDIENLIMQTTGSRTRWAGGGRVDKTLSAFEQVAARIRKELEERGAMPKRRFERLIDENPGVHKVADIDSLKSLAYSDDALVNLNPDEYMSLAMKISPNYQSLFDKELSQFKKSIGNERIRSVPQLDLQSVGGDTNVIGVVGHDGRHRAQVFGDKNLKVPTRLWFPGLRSTFNSGEEVADWVRNKSFVPEKEFYNDWRKLPRGEVRPEFVPDEYFNIKDRAFAEGGQVDKKRTLSERYLSWMGPASNIGVPVPGAPLGATTRDSALLQRGLTSMVLGLDDETGEVGFSTYPGVVSDFVALPDTLASFAGRRGPEWSQRAQARSEAVRGRINEIMGMSPAKGFKENLYESAGEMSGQIPIPASKIKYLKAALNRLPHAKSAMGKGLSTALSSPIEYLSPTIDPSAGNYLAGSLFGATAGTLGGEEEPEIIDYRGDGMKFPNSPLMKAMGGRIPTRRPIARPMAQPLMPPARLPGMRIPGNPMMGAPRRMFADGGTIREEYGTLTPDMGNMFDSAVHNVVPGRADGGRVMKTARAIHAIKNAITHLEGGDKASAIRALSSPDAASDPDIMKMLGTLRAPAGNPLPLMRGAVEADTNRLVPLLEDGGRVSDRTHELLNEAGRMDDMGYTDYAPTARRVARMAPYMAKGGRVLRALRALTDSDISTELRELDKNPKAMGAIDRRGNVYDPTPPGMDSPRRRYQDLLDERVRRKTPIPPPTTKFAEGGKVHNPANDYEPGLNKKANLKAGWAPNLTKAERDDIERRFPPGYTPSQINKKAMVKKAKGGKVVGALSKLRVIETGLPRVRDPFYFPPVKTAPRSPPFTKEGSKAGLRKIQADFDDLLAHGSIKPSDHARLMKGLELPIKKPPSP